MIYSSKLTLLYNNLKRAKAIFQTYRNRSFYFKMKKSSANSDMFKVQQTIMNNSRGIQEYMEDLNSWVSDATKSEQKNVQKVAQVRMFSNLYVTLNCRNKTKCHFLRSVIESTFPSSLRRRKRRSKRKRLRVNRNQPQKKQTQMIFSRRKIFKERRKKRLSINAM